MCDWLLPNTDKACYIITSEVELSRLFVVNKSMKRSCDRSRQYCALVCHLDGVEDGIIERTHGGEVGGRLPNALSGAMNRTGYMVNRTTRVASPTFETPMPK